MATPGPLSFQLVFGPVEIGSQISSALWGVTCVQTFMYAMRCRQDPIILKLLVGVVFVLETLLTIFLWIYMYDQAVIAGPTVNWGAVSPWTSIAEFVLHEVISALVQVFFAYRVKVISRKPILACISWATIAIRFAVAIAAASVMVVDGVEATVLRYAYLIDITMGLAILVDGWNTAILCRYLAKARKVVMESTSDRISAIMMLSIETGVVVFVVALFTLVAWAVSPFSGIWLGGMYIYARLYSNSLLVSLNTRVRDSKAKGTDSSPMAGTVGVTRTYEVQTDLATQTNYSESIRATNSKTSKEHEGPFSHC